MTPLTAQERQFCHEYLTLGVATKAAEAAGLKPGAGSRLLKDPRCRDLIEKLQQEREVEHSLTQGTIIQGLLRETKGPSHNGRVAAWIALARIRGLFQDNVNVRGSISVESKTVIYLPDNGRGDVDERTITVEQPPAPAQLPA